MDFLNLSQINPLGLLIMIAGVGLNIVGARMEKVPLRLLAALVVLIGALHTIRLIG